MKRIILLPLLMVGVGTSLLYFSLNMNDITSRDPLAVAVRQGCVSSINYDHLSVFPGYTQPMTMETEWVCNLHHTVKQVTGRQITLLVSDEKYFDTLVNWLAHSILHGFQSVNSILIISFDAFTHDTLSHKGFISIHIPPDTVMKPNQTGNKFAYIWITRVMVVRLLNYWKYDVLMCDSDAILLKNIYRFMNRLSLSDSDIIASAGRFPRKYRDKWNAPTMCMGVILLRSSPATEEFWFKVKTVIFNVDDQMRINKALDSMGVHWKSINKDGFYRGITDGDIPLTLTSLPESVICRSCDKHLLVKPYYIWHQRGIKDGEVKKDSLAATHLWLLKDGWVDTLTDTSQSAEQWLIDISNFNYAMS